MIDSALVYRAWIQVQTSKLQEKDNTKLNLKLDKY